MSYKERKKLDIARIVHELGGPKNVSEQMGIPRTAPYRWIRHGNITLKTLLALEATHPALKVYYTIDGRNTRSVRREQQTKRERVQSRQRTHDVGDGVVDHPDQSIDQEATYTMEDLPEQTTD